MARAFRRAYSASVAVLDFRGHCVVAPIEIPPSANTIAPDEVNNASTVAVNPTFLALPRRVVDNA